jgi:hypothetical protein
LVQGKTLVAETLVAGRGVCKESRAVGMTPILCSGRSAGIRHNIAQERQEETGVGEQNNTFVPA